MSDETCRHPGPEQFGASEVDWRGDGTGRVTVPCRGCGERIDWTVEEAA